MSRLRTQMTRSPSASAAMSLSASSTSSLGVLAYPGVVGGVAGGVGGSIGAGFNTSFDATSNSRASSALSPGANVHPKYQQWLHDRLVINFFGLILGYSWITI